MIKTAHRQIVACAAALALGMAAIPDQAASEIGVAAAVNPQATGHPTGGSARTIVLGGKLTFKERVETTDGGLVQVLLLDGSTFTVGPNSDLVIDEFVYNPDTGKRHDCRGRGATKQPSRNHSPAFKAKVAVAALKGEKTLVDPSGLRGPIHLF
jgi:hypothetical protein